MTRIKKRALRWLLKDLSRTSGLVRHGEFELRDWLAEPPDEMNRWMADDVIDMLRLFSTHGHSGSSAPFALAVFDALAKWKPWGPLTGQDDEWNEVGEGVYQNRRCSRVFKDADGSAYDIEGRIFREPDGCCFTNGESRTPVTFPYTPTTEFVDVPAPEARG